MRPEIAISIPSIIEVLAYTSPGPLVVRHNLSNGKNKDIIDLIKKEFKPACMQLNQAASLFRTGNILEDGLAVYYFLKKNVSFIPDSDSLQILQLPKTILTTRKADCKSFCMFSACVMYLNGYDVAFNFCYKPGYDVPTHVFCSYGKCEPKNPTESWLIPLDATINEFNKVPEGFNKIASFVFLTNIKK